MIDRLTIEKIQETATIYDVVSDFVSLKKRGVNYVGLCPFHQDKTPSFYVSPSKNICKCFSCGEGGTPIHFIMKHENISYAEALKFLAKKYGIEIIEKELTSEEKLFQDTKESIFILNDFAKNYFINNLKHRPEGKAIALSYFKDRGFRDDIIEKFQLGYSLDIRDGLSLEAKKNGFKKEYLLKSGLSIDNNGSLVDRFRGRIIFPVHTLSGKTVAFGGRIIGNFDKTAKYINSPESDIYSKSNELYGIYFAKKEITKQNKCFLVEGYTDVISMHQAGIENVVASSGTALTKGQIKKINRFSNNVTVLYDGDSAGINAAIKGVNLLLEEGLNVKIVVLPEGEDPDSFARKQNATDFNKYINDNEIDFIQFKAKILLKTTKNDPLKRSELISGIIESISLIPNSVVRTVYIQDTSRVLDIKESILTDEVNKICITRFNKQKEQENNNNREHISENIIGELNEITQTKKTNKYNIIEKEIIRYIIRYGTLPLYKIVKEEKDESGKSIETIEYGPSVIEFINEDLIDDGFNFTNNIYKKIFEEAKQKSIEKTFIPEKYFINHQSQEISKIASDLILDKYQISKMHYRLIGETEENENSSLKEKNNLKTNLPRLTTDLKNLYILDEISQVKKSLKTVETKEKEDDLLKRLKELNNIKKQLANNLGDRVILKFY